MAEEVPKEVKDALERFRTISTQQSHLYPNPTPKEKQTPERLRELAEKGKPYIEQFRELEKTLTAEERALLRFDGLNRGQEITRHRELERRKREEQAELNVIMEKYNLKTPKKEFQGGGGSS